MAGLKLAIPGYVAAVALFWLWLGAREDLASEIDACNTRAVEAVAEAERAARQAEREATQAEIDRQRRIAASQAKAREIVAEALREAEAREPEIREVVKNVPRVELAAQCLDLPVPDFVARRLRD